MDAGRLRHRVTIEQATETEGSLGQPVNTWSAFKKRFAANVVQLTGRELFNAQQLQSDIAFKVQMRWVSGITDKMRLKWHDGSTDRTLAIQVPPINPDGKKIEMVLMCMEPK